MPKQFKLFKLSPDQEYWQEKFQGLPVGSLENMLTRNDHSIISIIEVHKVVVQFMQAIATNRRLSLTEDQGRVISKLELKISELKSSVSIIKNDDDDKNQAVDKDRLIEELANQLDLFKAEQDKCEHLSQAILETMLDTFYADFNLMTLNAISALIRSGSTHDLSDMKRLHEFCKAAEDTIPKKRMSNPFAYRELQKQLVNTFMEYIFPLMCQPGKSGGFSADKLVISDKLCCDFVQRLLPILSETVLAEIKQDRSDYCLV